MRGVGADDPLATGRRLGREVSAHVARRDSVAAKAREGEVREVLADPRTRPEHLGYRAGDRGRRLVVVEVGLDAVHEVGGRFADRSPGGQGCRGIRVGVGDVLSLRGLHSELRGGPGAGRIRMLHRTRLLPGQRQRRTVVAGCFDGHVGAGVDDQARVGHSDVEVRHDVAEGIPLVADVVRLGIYRHGVRRDLLPRDRSRGHVREPEAVAHIVAVFVDGPVRHRVLHASLLTRVPP